MTTELAPLLRPKSAAARGRGFFTTRAALLALALVVGALIGAVALERGGATIEDRSPALGEASLEESQVPLGSLNDREDATSDLGRGLFHHHHHHRRHHFNPFAVARAIQARVRAAHAKILARIRAAAAAKKAADAKRAAELKAAAAKHMQELKDKAARAMHAEAARKNAENALRDARAAHAKVAAAAKAAAAKAKAEKAHRRAQG